MKQLITDICIKNQLYPELASKIYDYAYESPRSGRSFENWDRKDRIMMIGRLFKKHGISNKDAFITFFKMTKPVPLRPIFNHPMQQLVYQLQRGVLDQEEFQDAEYFAYMNMPVYRH